MKQEEKKCCVCGGRFSCNFAGKPYCNKHWQRRIMLDRKEIQLGRFDTYEEAVKAREQAEIKYFGEFAPIARSEA